MRTLAQIKTKDTQKAFLNRELAGISVFQRKKQNRVTQFPPPGYTRLLCQAPPISRLGQHQQETRGEGGTTRQLATRCGSGNLFGLSKTYEPKDFFLMALSFLFLFL